MQPLSPAVRNTVSPQLNQRQGGLYFPQFDDHAKTALTVSYAALHQLFSAHKPYFNNLVTKGMNFSPSAELSNTMHAAQQLGRFPFELKLNPLPGNPKGTYVELYHDAAKDAKTGQLKPDFAHVINRLERNMANFISAGLGETFPHIPFQLHPPEVGVHELNPNSSLNELEGLNPSRANSNPLLNQPARYANVDNEKRPSPRPAHEYGVSLPMEGALNAIKPFNRHA